MQETLASKWARPRAGAGEREGYGGPRDVTSLSLSLSKLFSSLIRGILAFGLDIMIWSK